jgi:acyl-CoA reductase-like NAD-dependent aldehyde dehydrogenase
VPALAAGTEADAGAAVLAARSAFPVWANTSGSDRGAILRKIAAEVLRYGLSLPGCVSRLVYTRSVLTAK